MIRKIIILTLIVISITGCNTEKNNRSSEKCKSETKIEYSPTSTLSLNGKEITSDDLINYYNDTTFQILIENLESEMLNQEFGKREKNEATEYTNSYIKQLTETYEAYGLKIEDIIKEYTNYTSVEEMRNQVESYYLYELFSKNFAKENNISEDEILNCKYTYTIKKELHTKYKLSFSNETLNELYENYMEKEKDNSTYCED